MIRPVPDTAVAMTVQGVVAYSDPIEQIEQIRVAACSGLDDRNAGRGMRDEDREEPVALVMREGGDGIG